MAVGELERAQGTGLSRTLLKRVPVSTKVFRSHRCRFQERQQPACHLLRRSKRYACRWHVHYSFGAMPTCALATSFLADACHLGDRNVGEITCAADRPGLAPPPKMSARTVRLGCRRGCSSDHDRKRHPRLSSREKSLVRKCSGKPRSSDQRFGKRHFRVRVLSPQPRSQSLQLI